MSSRRSNYGSIISEKQTSEFAKVATIVCVFVMMREFRPVEPFMTSYLTDPPISLTTDEVNEKIYPIGTYASCTFAVFTFLVTDYFRYKPVILLDGITGILTYVLLVGKPSMLQLTIEQIFFGFFYSSDTASNTYLYAKIDVPAQFQKITGYVRASCLIGRFLSGIFSQLVVSFNILEKNQLMYVSIAGMVFVTFWSFLIPSVQHSIYFHRVQKQVIPVVDKKDDALKNTELLEKSEMIAISTVISEKFSVVCKLLWTDFREAYTNLYVLKWSMWWSFCLCGTFFVNTYSQVLWQTIADEYGGDQYLMNGAVESISTLLSALSAYLISRTALNWRFYGNLILTLVTALLSLLLLYTYMGSSLWLVYGTYITYSTVFQTLLTIAQSEVAQNLKKDSYALIFGFNHFLALGLGSVITYSVIEGNLIHFTTREQFLFYSVYYAVITIIILVKAVIDLCSWQKMWTL